MDKTFSYSEAEAPSWWGRVHKATFQDGCSTPACNLRGVSVLPPRGAGRFLGVWSRLAHLGRRVGLRSPSSCSFTGSQKTIQSPEQWHVFRSAFPCMQLTALLKLLLSCFGSFRISCWHCRPSDFSSSSITRNPFRNSMPEQSRMLLLI